MNSRILVMALTATLLAAPLSGVQAASLRDVGKLAKSRLASSPAAGKFSLQKSAAGAKRLLRINAAMLRCFLNKATDKPC